MADAEPAFLLDTNILIYLIDGNSESLLAAVQRRAPGEVVTSALCAAEALYGLRDDPSGEAALARLLRVVTPLAFDMDAAIALQKLPFKRNRLDRFIGAHVKARGLVLVTNNESDFADIPGLLIENWTLSA